MRIGLLVILLLVLTSCLAKTKLPPLTTVDKVDLNRYLGLWYQFAYYPTSFQPKDAGLTTAEYALSSKGYVIVKNTAYQDWEGKTVKSDITGKAFVQDNINYTKLKVQFFWPIRAPYWIIGLDKDHYQWAIVSEPRRKYLWILTRQKTISHELYDQLLQLCRDKQLDLKKIVVTGRFE